MEQFRRHGIERMVRASVPHDEGDVQLLPGSTPGPRTRVSITPIKFSQPGADNPGGIENGIKQLADGKTSGGPERRAHYGGD